MKYSYVYFWITISRFGQKQSDGIKERLERFVPDTNQSDLSIRSAFVHTLTVADLPGDLELRETCGAKGMNPSPPKASNVRAVLDEIVYVRPELSMQIADDGFVLLNSRHQQNTILDSRLERVEIPDIQDLVRTGGYSSPRH